MVFVRCRSGMRRRPSVSIAIALALIAACTAQASDTPPGQPNISATPTVAPLPPRVVNANAFTTRTPIKHVVFLIKENRTFDNLFGTFPGANGQTWGMDYGVSRPLTRGTDQRAHDIPHCYPCALAAYDGGRMDGFNQSVYADQWAYTQLHKDQLPNYWHWAGQNVLFDNFFASAQGPSFPNHLYSIAAQ